MKNRINYYLTSQDGSFWKTDGHIECHDSMSAAEDRIEELSELLTANDIEVGINIQPGRVDLGKPYIDMIGMTEDIVGDQPAEQVPGASIDYYDVMFSFRDDGGIMPELGEEFHNMDYDQAQAVVDGLKAKHPTAYVHKR